MTDQSDRAELRSAVSDRAGAGARLDQERRKAGLLGDVREAIFGAQDGLVSTLAVVSTVSGATNDRFPVLIAGIAAGLAYGAMSAVRSGATVIPEFPLKEATTEVHAR